MVVDVLRSFHATRAFIDQARTVETRLRWYPSRPGALPFPVQHAFGSPVWEPDRGENFIGPSCVFDGLKYRSRRFAAPDGQHYHGELVWFKTGLPSEVLANIADYQRPICEGYATEHKAMIGITGTFSVSTVLPEEMYVGVQMIFQVFVFPP